jgi:alcohol dehydrogenase (cytochrome c)
MSPSLSRVKNLIAAAVLLAPAVAGAAGKDWPSYNHSLVSDRLSPLTEINRNNAKDLRQICSYDTGVEMSFQSGLIETSGSLFGTVGSDTFALDPDTCVLKWRVHEDIPAGTLRVNRGAAYLDGRLFRGFADGSVVAYDARTGHKLWRSVIANQRAGESVPAAPIAWKGRIFVGNAGGDSKGVKGRMYSLDAASGRTLWEAYLVPKAPTDPVLGPPAPPPPREAYKSWKNKDGFPITGGATWTSYTLDPKTGLLYVPGGNPAPDFMNSVREGDNLFTGSVVVLDAKTGAYVRHFQMVPHDFHDWDVSTAPLLATTKSGRKLMVSSPKDGHLYGFELSSGQRVYRKDVTTILNADTPMGPEEVRFCPGAQGGAEWNGPAFDPTDNLIFTGEVDWCTNVKLAPEDKVVSAALAQPWSGVGFEERSYIFGRLDPPSGWAGWLTASDADTGEKIWQFKAPTPLLGGVTSTAGGLVFFGDMNGTLYAFDAAKGIQLWSQKVGGPIGGGVISYEGKRGAQRIAVAAGMNSPIWPTEKATAKVVVLGVR